jgi:hypothetical protein
MNHHSINLRADEHKQAVTHIRESQRFESIYILQEKPDTHDTYVLVTSRTRQPFA